MLTRNSLRIPKSWHILAGGDTGTYMGGVCCAIDPNYELYVLDVYPNYHYTGDGTIELLGMTVGEWFRMVGKSLAYWNRGRGVRKYDMWVDANTTFKSEVANGVRFKMNKKRLELRTEVTREYLRNNRIHVMPWCESILLYEMEEAHYPEEESASSGEYKRMKKKDHSLDGLEHVCSRRPKPQAEEVEEAAKTPIRALIDWQKSRAGVVPDPVDHWLGQN